jgi:hypothetical protein
MRSARIPGLPTAPAGLAQVEARTKPEYVAALENVQDPLYRSIAEKLAPGVTAADLVTSADVRAVKPTRCC